MYIPALYKNEDAEEIRDFIKRTSFAVVVNQTEGKLWATHVPLVLDVTATGKELLVGHVSKLNPQAESFKNEAEVLVIFSGPNAYISSSWYDHENVPTWNYLAVHVYGTVRLYTKAEALLSLKKLVDHFETRSEKPVRVEDLSEKTMREANGIIAFEIEITAIEAMKKLSQNRDDKNHENIVTELQKTNDNQAIAIAEAMKKNRTT